MRALSLGICASLAAASALGAPSGPVLHISSHLARAAKVSVDGRPAVTAPRFGSVETPIAAGRHLLTVTAPGGVAYQRPLILRPQILMHWRGRAYWCVNLLRDGVQPYDREDCQEEVTDAG